MKILLLLLLTTPLFAQNIWQEYIVGMPMRGFVDARKATAKEWGINYKVITAGCIIDTTISQNIEKYKKSNEPYLDKLTKKYGDSWVELFNLECKIAMLKANNSLQGKWVDPVAGRPMKSYFDAKQELANYWGIAYQPLFLGCVIEQMSKEQSEKAEKGATYFRQLNSVLGDNWKKHFDRELQKKVQLKNPAIKGTWEEYLLEKVDENYYKIKQKTLANWGIAYQPHFVACCSHKKQRMKKGKYKEKSNDFQKKITTIYGDDWQKYLKIEIEKQR